MERIGVIADIHANGEALKSVLEDMPQVDRKICAGDLVGYGPEPDEVIELIKSKDILTVMGNHDQAVANGEFSSLSKSAAKAARWTRKNLEEENLDFLEGLPEKIQVEIEGYKVFMAHGTPRSPFKEYLYPGVSDRVLTKMTQGVDADVVILGHTHVPLERIIQERLILNPGAVGQPRDRDPKASYTVLKLGREKEVIQKRISYNIDETEQKIKDSGLPERFATRLHFGW